MFGTPEPEPEPRNKKGRAVGPAEVPADVRGIVEALPPNVRLGTSSWSFPGWHGLVYDRAASEQQLARQGLAAYAHHPLLRTVGIDRTFYGPLGVDDFAAYAEAVPDDFRFLVKAWGQCTMPLLRDGTGRLAEPNPSFLDAAFAEREVIGAFCEGLGEKAGPLVFQFPPLGRSTTAEPQRFCERLAGFLAALRAGPLYAVELRDRKLFGASYLDALESAGATHCFNVHPRMPALAAQWKVAGSRPSDALVVRWMLHSGLRYKEALERYEPFDKLVDEDAETRETLARLAVEEIPATRPIVIVANNKAEGSAPRTVFKLAEAIAAQRISFREARNDTAAAEDRSPG